MRKVSMQTDPIQKRAEQLEKPGALRQEKIFDF